ncbi:unnamed protein product [Heterobilharzia americana]|nr:unnamed protein product [Heterobilharzia americana]
MIFEYYSAYHNLPFCTYFISVNFTKYHTTAVGLVLFGSESQKLESVDSFLFNVIISPSEKFNLVENINPPVYYDYLNYDKEAFGHPTQPQPHFFITPANLGHSSGDISVQVIIRSSLPQRYAPFLPGIQSLQSVLNVYLSPMVHVIPSHKILLFYHPDASSSVYIHGGSGHYHLESSGDFTDSHHHPLRITEQSNEPTVITGIMSSIMPRRAYKLQPKHVGHAIIETIDLCFPALLESNQLIEKQFSPAQTDFSVDVIGLSAINLRVLDRIQLGDEVTAFIEAIGTDGLVLPAKFARLLKLSIVSDHVTYSPSIGHKESYDSKRILGVPDTDIPAESFWIFNSSTLEQPCLGQFSVRGMALGTSRLMVSSVVPGFSRNKPITVQSNVVEIQVFAPLRLTPCNFNLLLGAEYEIHAVGGPSQASLEFVPEPTSGRITVLKANPTSALIRASESLGLATIRARAVGIAGGKHSGIWKESRMTIWSIQRQFAVFMSLRCLVYVLDALWPT